MQPSAETAVPNNIIHMIQPGDWVAKSVIKTMFGFTEDLIKKYRSQFWLEGKHYRKNPANTIVYSIEEINRWNQGY